jgi:hypothetical protein
MKKQAKTQLAKNVFDTVGRLVYTVGRLVYTVWINTLCFHGRMGLLHRIHIIPCQCPILYRLQVAHDSVGSGGSTVLIQFEQITNLVIALDAGGAPR